jgi:hypothetical protein
MMLLLNSESYNDLPHANGSSGVKLVVIASQGSDWDAGSWAPTKFAEVGAGWDRAGNPPTRFARDSKIFRCALNKIPTAEIQVLILLEIF